MDTEKILPTDLKINTHFGDFEEVMHAEIAAVQAAQDGDILDREQEFASFETIATFEKLTAFITKYILETEDNDARAAMYRAAMFAFQSASIVIGDKTGFNPGPYLNHLVNDYAENRLEQLTIDVHTYLGENPNIDTFIGYYIDQIDEGRHKYTEIELVAGMMFLLIERKIAERFMDDTREHMSMENFVN